MPPFGLIDVIETGLFDVIGLLRSLLITAVEFVFNLPVKPGTSFSQLVNIIIAKEAAKIEFEKYFFIFIIFYFTPTL